MARKLVQSCIDGGATSRPGSVDTAIMRLVDVGDPAVVTGLRLEHRMPNLQQPCPVVHRLPRHHPSVHPQVGLDMGHGLGRCASHPLHLHVTGDQGHLRGGHSALFWRIELR